MGSQETMGTTTAYVNARAAVRAEPRRGGRPRAVCRASGLRREARAAAARVLGVRVLEREARLAELPLDVVDLDAHQVHGRHRVDEAADALHLEDRVAGL